jgi:hypothetical protein
MPAARPWLSLSALPFCALAWLTACARDPAQARQAEIRRAWERDPAEAIALVNQLDELQQLTVIEQVFEPRGGMGAGGTPCERLDRPVVEERCRRIMSRVHLQFYGAPEQGDAEAERACLQQTGVDPGQQDTPFGLATEAARRGAGLEEGLAACRCLQGERLRDECTFALAETLARQPAARAQAIDACAHLRPRVVPMCVEHTLSLANVRLDLGSTTGARWTEAERFAERIGHLPPELAQDSADGLLGFYWSYVMFESIAAALEAPGGERLLPAGLTERLPAEALPHARSAVAWAVLATLPEGARDATDPAAMVGAILAGAAPLPGVGDGGRPSFPMGCGTVAEPSGRASIRRHYLTRLVESRLGSADAEQDLTLAVAAARSCLDPARRPPTLPYGAPPPPP